MKDHGQQNKLKYHGQQQQHEMTLCHDSILVSCIHVVGIGTQDI